MMNLLKDLYNKAEAIKGKKLVFVIIGVFLSFLLIGTMIGYFTSSYLKNNEPISVEVNEEQTEPEEVIKTLEGKIIYVNPEFYPGENISFILTDNDNNQLILLRAKDQILKVAENLNVSVTGVLSATADGSKEVLEVEKVTIKNGSN